MGNRPRPPAALSVVLAAPVAGDVFPSENVTLLSHSNWCDIKVFGDYAYAVNESGGGIDVIDLSNADNTLSRSFNG